MYKNALSVILFLSLSLADFLIISADLTPLVEMVLCLAANGAACSFLLIFRRGSSSSPVQRAKDRVSTAVIGLLHSTSGISSLRTYNELIRGQAEKGGPLTELLDQERVIIDEYSEKVKAIVSDLSNSFRTEKISTDLVPLAAQSVEFIRLKRIREIRIPLLFDAPEVPVCASVHPALLKTALENIIDNSYDELIDSGREEGRIGISVASGRRRVRITVSDNGRGYRGIQGEVPRRFILPGRTGKRKGNGLGLYSALQSVEECGGTLSMVSGPGGLKTTIEFPAK